jgi:hypothetical protein
VAALKLDNQGWADVATLIAGVNAARAISSPIKIWKKLSGTRLEIETNHDFLFPQMDGKYVQIGDTRSRSLADQSCLLC